MAHIDNRSALTHAWFEKTGPAGEVYDVLAVRGTFDFPAQGQTLTLASRQTPIAWGDEHQGPADEPLRMVLAREGDAVLYKPRADLLITGTARTADAQPMQSWLARVTVGAHRKTLQLHGPRRFELGFVDWKLTAPQATTQVALDYRLAFGGLFTAPAQGQESARSLYKPDNPAGCGWLPDTKALRPLSKRARDHIQAQIRALRHMPAPQIEDPKRPIKYPDEPRPAQGVAPIARWWQPRLSHLGTRDENWLRQRYPQPPQDFNPAYYQSAHPDLILPGRLKGDEAITLEGLLPEGARTLHLPALRVIGLTEQASNKKSAGQLALDTVRLDLDSRQAVLVWRATFERADPVRQIALAALMTPTKARHG